MLVGTPGQEQSVGEHSTRNPANPDHAAGAETVAWIRPDNKPVVGSDVRPA